MNVSIMIPTRLQISQLMRLLFIYLIFFMKESITFSDYTDYGIEIVAMVCFTSI